MDGWKTIVSCWDGLFSGAFAVSFREGNHPDSHIQSQLHLPKPFGNPSPSIASGRPEMHVAQPQPPLGGNGWFNGSEVYTTCFTKFSKHIFRVNAQNTQIMVLPYDSDDFPTVNQTLGRATRKNHS